MTNKVPCKKSQHTDMDAGITSTKKFLEMRLNYLRNRIKHECISQSEIVELQSLVDYIDPNDTLLLQWAGVEE
jgi:hypothetical protein